MLKAAIDTEVFKEAVEVVAAIVSECRLNISANGLAVRAVDTANVAMISLELGAPAFNTFAAGDSQIGLDISKLKNIVASINKADVLSLDLPDGAYKMELAYGGFKYSISLLDVNTVRKDPNLPSIQLPGKVVIAGAELNNAIKAASLVSDKIAFGINPDNETFYMEADGDTDHINLEIKAADLKTFIPAEARSLFSLDYLKDMGRVMSKAEEVEIFLGKDHPVKFVFTIAGGEGKVEYLLAPRIESD
ncbi:MAG: DNA polymerase sliding clamp [Methanomicrobium sp.]|nr:DNA polymerase sliding clamp [Methanomicrobium sp.]